MVDCNLPKVRFSVCPGNLFVRAAACASQLEMAEKQENLVSHWFSPRNAARVSGAKVFSSIATKGEIYRVGVPKTRLSWLSWFLPCPRQVLYTGLTGFLLEAGLLRTMGKSVL